MARNPTAPAVQRPLRRLTPVDASTRPPVDLQPCCTATMLRARAAAWVLFACLSVALHARSVVDSSAPPLGAGEWPWRPAFAVVPLACPLLLMLGSVFASTACILVCTTVP